MTVGELKQVLDRERATQEVHVMTDGLTQYQIVGVSVRRVVSDADPAPVVLIVKRRS